MSKTVFEDGDDGVKLIVKGSGKKKETIHTPSTRSPVHVVYGGADRFSAATPRKLGDLALRAINEFAPNFVEFANAMRLPGTETLPHYPEAVARLEEQILRNGERAREENGSALFAYRVYRKTIEKLTSEPVEDYRIDFEDGYGVRPDHEEDADAERSATELADSFNSSLITVSSGLRIKPLGVMTYGRAVRTLKIFVETLLRKTNGVLPANFVVTLPKVRSRKEVKELSRLVKGIERSAGIESGSIGIELMVETPEALLDRKGRVPLAAFVRAGKGRVTSAHFGAFDYTSAIGISAEHQTLRHPACDLAKQLMLLSLAGSGVRLSDSVTTDLPVPVHRGNELSETQIAENKRAVHAGWREHYRNVSHSISQGFYQSWDLHPNQFVARYAACLLYTSDAADEFR
ncbi:MAG: aldolase/citrate lyase family protein, partial [Pyrinomonadaceae bacterium]|nr:aldolase/citrate lyase family protein [Pyrinomonadaceae bacterium]